MLDEAFFEGALETRAADSSNSDPIMASTKLLTPVPYTGPTILSLNMACLNCRTAGTNTICLAE